LALTYIKKAREIYSASDDWEWEEPVLWLHSTSSFHGPHQVAYTYYQDISRFEDVPTPEQGDVKDYFMNLMKRTVGEIRGKFGTVPGPGANSIRGSEMIQQANDELRRISTDWQKRSIALVPPYGPARGR